MSFYDSWRGGGTGRGAYTLKSRTATEVPLTLQGVSGQTANLLELKDDTGTVVFNVDNSGNLTFQGSGTIVIDTTVTGDLTAGTLTVTGDTTLAGLTASTLSVTGATTFTGDVVANHNLTVNNNLIANGFAYFNAQVDLNGNDLYVGNIFVDAGSNIDTATAGTLNIGTTNQTGIVLGRSGQTVTINSSGTWNGSLYEITGGSFLIDSNNAEVFLVRKNADAGDVFAVDTSSSLTKFNGLTDVTGSATLGLTIAPTTITTAGTDDAALSLTHTLNASAGTGGTDNYSGIKFALTTTDIAGYDGEVNFLTFLDDGNTKFRMTVAGALKVDDTTGGLSLSTDGSGVSQIAGQTALNVEIGYDNAGTFTPMAKFVNTASQVNQVQFTGSATGGNVTVEAVGSDAAVQLDIKSKGTDGILLANSSDIAIWSHTGFAIDNGITFGITQDAETTDTATTALSITAQSAYQNASSLTNPNGAPLNLFGGSGNLLDATSAQGGAVRLAPGKSVNDSQGVEFLDNATDLTSLGKIGDNGNSDFSFFTGDNTTNFEFGHFSGAGAWQPALVVDQVASQVNYFNVLASATTNGVAISAAGTDSNIDLEIASKGTGDIKSTNGFWLPTVTAGITASTSQTQGNGALTTEVNEVATVANTNDTVTLPTAVAGRKVEIFNNGANTLQIFPASGDNLGAGVDTATTLAAGSNLVLRAYDATNWETL